MLYSDPNQLLSKIIINTRSDESLDQIVKLVSKSIGSKLCGIAIMDGEIQYFKYAHGFPAGTRYPKHLSYCSRVMESSELYIVNNALNESEWRDSYHVKYNNFMSYMGAPIYDYNNEPIGALCVLDFEKQEFTSKQQDILVSFAAVVTKQIQKIIESQFDQETGFLSKEQWVNVLDYYTNQKEQSFVVSTIDLNKFKNVTSKVGTVRTAQIISEIRDIIVKYLDENSIVGRLDSDTFGIISTNQSWEYVKEQMQCIKRMILYCTPTEDNYTLVDSTICVMLDAQYEKTSANIMDTISISHQQAKKSQNMSKSIVVIQKNNYIDNN